MNPDPRFPRARRALEKVPSRAGRVVVATAGTAAALAILLSFKTGGTAGPLSVPAVQSAPSGPPRPAASQASHGAPGPAGAGHASAVPKTLAGDVTQTAFGPVQVAITVKSGKITAVSVPQYPSGQQISSAALPQLTQETLTAGSANISAVSGATYTSQGYIASLQSAIDKARR